MIYKLEQCVTILSAHFLTLELGELCLQAPQSCLLLPDNCLPALIFLDLLIQNALSAL